MTVYLVAMLTQIGFYGLLALSLNLQWGYSGLLNFGLVGFFAVGAYGFGIATTTYEWNPIAAIILAMALGAIVAYPVGLASIRLRIGFYLAIVTLGLGELIRAVIINEDWLTQGTRGLAVSMLFPDLSSWHNQLILLAIVAVCVLVVFVLIDKIAISPFGRTLEAIRDNEEAARSLGKPVASFKIKVFMLGSAIAAGAGALNAVYVGYLVPDQFLPIMTFNVWMAMIIGGSGSNRGVLLGGVILVFFMEGSRFLNGLMPEGLSISTGQMASLRLMAIGAALMLIPVYWPRGIWGRKDL